MYLHLSVMLQVLSIGILTVVSDQSSVMLQVFISSLLYSIYIPISDATSTQYWFINCCFRSVIGDVTSTHLLFIVSISTFISDATSIQCWHINCSFRSVIGDVTSTHLLFIVQYLYSC